MKKPPIGSYDRFTEAFRCASDKAGKEQYLIPYFISGHPGTLDDMIALALYLKHNGSVRPGAGLHPDADVAGGDHVPHGKDPCRKVSATSEEVSVVRGGRQRRVRRRSFAITIRKTGRCCARRCSAWAAAISSATARST